MFDLDIWQEIISTIKKNKLRSFLTGFAVAWGIFMLMILLGSGNGLSNGVVSNFEGDAKNAMWIWTRKTSMPYAGLKTDRYFDLDIKDYNDVSKLDGVDLISGRYWVGEMMCSYGKESGSYSIQSSHPDYCKIENYAIVQGRFVNEIDIDQKRKVIVIGNDIRKAFFNRENPLGKYLQVGNTPFKIVGIYDEIEGRNESNQCFIPITTGQSIFNSKGEMGNLALTTIDMSTFENMALEQQIWRLLASNHRVHPEDQRAIGIYNSLESYTQTMAIFKAINMFIWLIGIGTLIAGVVGVGNIMLISVKERTKEFGIRKAIGASPSSIVGLVLLEAVFITSLAGYLGLLTGVTLMEVVNYIMEQNVSQNGGTTLFLNPTVDLRVAFSAMILLIVVGSIAGLIPARHAALVKPIDALHDE